MVLLQFGIRPAGRRSHQLSELLVEKSAVREHLIPCERYGKLAFTLKIFKINSGLLLGSIAGNKFRFFSFKENSRIFLFFFFSVCYGVGTWRTTLSSIF